MNLLNKKTYIVIFLFFFILIYVYLQSYNVLRGPIINIKSPINGETYNGPDLSISGLAKNISKISMDGRPIFMTKNGEFNEKLMLFKGYNIIILSANDKFGKKIEKRLEVICRCERN